MNRRQFLGRFFQAVATAHNSKSIYGLYHSWHQHQTVYSTLSVACKYRYDANSTHELVSFMKKDTIMALYNDFGEMIWCSAYYKNGELINNFRGGVSKTNLAPGTYTVRCLALGKGLSLGENGASMTITIPDIDRTTLPYNNYGYINNPTVQAEFIFSASGIFFEVETTIDTIGYMYPQAPPKEATVVHISPPSYAECKAAYDACASEHGFSGTFSEDDYKRLILSKLSGKSFGGSVDYKMGPVYTDHPKLFIKYMEAFGSYTNISEIDMNGYLGYGSAAYWNVCEANGLTYDPENDYNATFIYPAMLYSEIIDGNGAYDEMYIYPENNYYNTHISIHGGFKFDFIDSVHGGHRYVTGYRAEYFEYNVKPVDANVRIRFSTPTWGSYRGTRMGFVNITSNCVKDVWKQYNNYNMDAYYDGPYEYTSEYNSISSIINFMERKVKERINEARKLYLDPAMKNYGTNPGDGSPWVATQQTGSVEYSIPLDALFGVITPDKSLMRVDSIASGTLSGVEAVYSTEGGEHISLIYGDVQNSLRTSEYKPVLEGFTADLSDYDPDHNCNDSSMWIAVDGKSVFMRQTTIPLDMNEVPDHQIT